MELDVKVCACRSFWIECYWCITVFGGFVFVFLRFEPFVFFFLGLGEIICLSFLSSSFIILHFWFLVSVDLFDIEKTVFPIKDESLLVFVFLAHIYNWYCCQFLPLFFWVVVISDWLWYFFFSFRINGHVHFLLSSSIRLAMSVALSVMFFMRFFIIS